MSIFESLESLNVSEECFDDIMGIVEEIIDEVLVGPHKEKGATGEEVNVKRALQKHFAGVLRGTRKHAVKNNKGREKEAKVLYNEIQQHKADTDKAWKKSDDSSNKANQAWKDRDQAQEGTELRDKLTDKAVKLSNKASKDFNKLENSWKRRDELNDKKVQLIKGAQKDENKRYKADRLMGSGDRNRYTDEPVADLANYGDKKWWKK